ncbi:hypothetical protein [Streptomyces sp. enrichment culture]|uniref:hypothetical protein n=1 Tax=Streptomyces sp. enrichment culture TaxID=1795815 RepID=UPI003F54A02A
MRRLAPVCLALAAALLGCSSGSGSGEGGGPAGAANSPAASVGSTAEPRVDYTARLPIARYSYTDAESAAIDAAQQILTRRCLRTFGISYEPPEPEPMTDPPADRRYGLSSEREAAALGYHPDLGPPQPGPDLPDDALRVFYGNRGADPSGGEHITYHGKAVPPDGCFGQAVHRLSRKYDDPAGAETARRIATGSHEDSLTHPAVKNAFRKWSACMRTAGFPYATPLEPLNNPAFRGEKVSTEEKRTALADVRCKKKTGLLDIWFQAESALQRAEIRRNAESLENLRTAHARKVEAARRIVREG